MQEAEERKDEEKLKEKLPQMAVVAGEVSEIDSEPWFELLAESPILRVFQRHRLSFGSRGGAQKGASGKAWTRDEHSRWKRASSSSTSSSSSSSSSSSGKASTGGNTAMITPTLRGKSDVIVSPRDTAGAGSLGLRGKGDPGKGGPESPPFLPLPVAMMASSLPHILPRLSFMPRDGGRKIGERKCCTAPSEGETAMNKGGVTAPRTVWTRLREDSVSYKDALLST